MPHRRKPKIQPPPGLTISPSDQNGPIVEDIQLVVHELRLQVQSLCILADELKSMNMRNRIELLERVLVFIDLDQLNSAFASVQAKAAATDENEYHVGHSDVYVDQDDDLAKWDGEPFDLLSGMASGSQEMSWYKAVIEVEGQSAWEDAVPTEPSLCMANRQQQEQNERTTARIARLCRISDAIGITGCVSKLMSQGLLSIGSILESTEHLHVGVMGFNGIRYLLASPVVVVSDIHRDSTVVLRDGATEPTRDRGGRVAFGEASPSQEVYMIVGHSSIGGIQIDFEEVSGHG